MAILTLDNGKTDNEILKKNKRTFDLLGIKIIKPSPYNAQVHNSIEKFLERLNHN